MNESHLFNLRIPSANLLNQELTTIDSEETLLGEKIDETKKEMEYIDSVLKKYQGVFDSLVVKLKGFEEERDLCFLKRDRLLADHNVFGDFNGGHASNGPISQHNGHGAANGVAVTYSSLFGGGSSGSTSGGRAVGSRVRKESEKKEDNSALDDLVAGLLKTLNEGVSLVNSQDELLPESCPLSEPPGYCNVSFDSKNSLSPIGSVGDSIKKEEDSFSEQNQHNLPAPGIGDESLEEDWLIPVSPTPPATSQPPRFVVKSVGPQLGYATKLAYNTVLALEASANGYVYKSLSDRSVMRYRFGNMKDCRYYPGHMDKVKVLCLDLNLHLLYTGCDDGKVRCFNVNTGSLLSEFSCEGSLICIEKGWDHCLVLATNKGWIYLVKNQFTQVLATHRTFNWICAVKPLVGQEKGNRRRLIVLPMKHKPTLIDAYDGKVVKEIGSQLIESKPCVQVNGGICILATQLDKEREAGKSLISVFDVNNDWNCIQKLTKEGIIATLKTNGHDLYMGVKFPSFGHIQCYKWQNRSLSLKWIACVAYVNSLAVLPSDIVLNGGPDGSVFNTTPNLKGPFLCTQSAKCKCKLPFARRKDLEFHYTKIPNVGT